MSTLGEVWLMISVIPKEGDHVDIHYVSIYTSINGLITLTSEVPVGRLSCIPAGYTWVSLT